MTEDNDWMDSFSEPLSKKCAKNVRVIKFIGFYDVVVLFEGQLIVAKNKGAKPQNYLVDDEKMDSIDIYHMSAPANTFADLEIEEIIADVDEDTYYRAYVSNIH